MDRCTECGRAWFPARRWCGACQRSDTIDPDSVLSGPAVLYSYTINHVSWLPGMEVPFVLGLAEFPATPGVRIPCRVRAADPASIRVGASLEIGFEDGVGVRIPSFAVIDEGDARGS